MIKEIKNLYLEIHKLNDNKIEIYSSDGVFTSFTTICKEDYSDYCDSRADEWLTSDFGNYDKWSKEDRKAIANKWIKAKKLPEGRYDYYFNLQSIQEIFREAVKKLAQGIGITNYTLELGRGYIKGVDFSKPRQRAEYIDTELKESDDEIIRKSLIDMLSQDYGLHKKEIAWLKSLKPQYHWKPEGQQLCCLRHMIDVSTVDKIDRQIVIDLYEQLKSL